MRTLCVSHGPRFAVALGISLLAGLATSAFAQGSRADYERAAALPELWKDKVLNELLKPVWLSAHQFVYRREIDSTHWSYVHVDARTGVKTPAFDHELIAQQIGEALGQTLDPDRLPFAHIAAQDSRLLLLIDQSTRIFALDAERTTASETPPESAAVFRLKPTAARKSGGNRHETALTFVNRSGETVQLLWLNSAGQAQSYGTLEHGNDHRQHTFVGHVWQVRGADDRELGTYRATPSIGLVLIDAEPQVAPSHDDPNDSPRTSPDKRWEAFIRNHNLFLRDRSSGEETALSDDGSADDRYTRRVYWSPDSQRLAVIRRRPAQEHKIHMIESSPDDQLQPKLHSLQYLKPGDRIAHPRPCLFDVAQRRQIPMDDALFPNPWSLTKLAWLPDSSAFTFLYNQRGHQLLRVIAVDASSGATRTVIEENSATFIDYFYKHFLRVLSETNEVIWMSERDGFNHLYMYDFAAGQVKHAITSGAWLVRGVERVDVEQQQIWFRAVGVYNDQDPYHIHFGRVNFDGSGLTWLTNGDGMHTLQYAPERQYFVSSYSRMDQAPVHELRRAEDGTLIAELERADWMPLKETGWRTPERFVAKGRDNETDIWGLIHYPTNFDPNQRYPVIENIYAGPHGHFVPKPFRAYTRSRQLAELGFIVVRIDGMGTNWRGKAFHDVAWQNLGDAGFPDRIKWIKAAAKTRPYMDLSRVGIYGGSAGGQSALRALLAHGDFYHAAMADCGCHDNRMDKIWWNELWMGWPVGPHYEEQSNVTQAHKLQGDLLLIVGELDRNVDPASTTQVVDALIKADKDFEYLLIPGGGHGVAATHPYAHRKFHDFFVRKLLKVEPRWEHAPKPSEY